MSSTGPSGQRILIRHGVYTAETVEVGAGLRTLHKDGVPLIAGYPPDRMCDAGRGQLLLPWPNRVRDGRYEFAGSTHQLPVNEVAAGNAIHGLTRWAPWTVLGRTDSAVRWGHVLHPQPGYPFRLRLECDYRLGDDGLTVTVTATNDGGSPAPYGHGMHPYLTVGRCVDECELTVPAGSYQEVDHRGLPTRTAPVAGTDYDFRAARAMGEVALDTPVTDLQRDEDGSCTVRLTEPGTGRHVVLRAGPAYRWLQLFTGDALGARAREALAVEPMTCPPDAFNSGTDLVVLEPGGRHSASYTITG